MRVIAGTAKGTILFAPRGREIRPTLDRVRTSLFDILGRKLEGATFLDLFAGTGANGIEALSRGAKMTWFVEKSIKAIQYIETNLKKTHLTEKAIIIKAELPQEVKLLPKGIDIIFMDPPYKFDKWEALIRSLILLNIPKHNSIIILEHSSFNPPLEEYPPLKKYRTEKYGDTILSFYS
ncbi:MAG TPA: 16S rRNA (guanine(966)-N(2))-methyltransferase RsmD [Candidatus Hydrogenedens sp.]|nr:16S rRNA (guanine(966)-N(2))-methyltransferase RsmD [Candidatus Hydrogenedens sp.]HOK09428.1 16S rRNA (guanine(966)-N(2))-methyltransferase RsmD [Candidatus Hydrogenedens sp.]HOL18981.1 16S rRNA (guanine(966)-N(2))-methyltransferase RsmD [Candidatus Hydrogenedens sp.]HPP58967.1 16S rRNA (guanine(966)-N(2))-methyltransferase RsmD [Candidatus Hydrogenedens sp.]